MTKEVTIEITQECPYSCTYCSTNADMMGSRPINRLTLKQIIDFVDKEQPDIINISGGEPLAHPYFYDILLYCKANVAEVWVYTNLLDNIRFNSDIISEGITSHANVVVRKGQINIPQADQVHLLELQQHGRAKNMDKVNFSVSGNNCGDCTHKVLQADSKVARPCEKEHKNKEEGK